jgi:Ni,Fe-hydrogenase I cytochrome b subunit
MMLILPIIFIGLFGFLIVILIIYGLAVINKVLPPNAFWLQQQIMRFTNRAKQGADIAVEPIIRIGSWASALKRFFRRFL